MLLASNNVCHVAKSKIYGHSVLAFTLIISQKIPFVTHDPIRPYSVLLEHIYFTV